MAGRTRRWLAALGSLLITASATLVSLPGARVPIAQAAGASVTIRNFSFQPPNLDVPVGTMVTWTNDDPFTHTTTSDSGLWNSGNAPSGTSFSFTFTTPGRYDYHCSIHRFMHGAITVEQSSPDLGWITGNVVDAGSGQPVPGGVVALADTPLRQGPLDAGGFQFAALSVTGGYGGTNEYNVRLVSPPPGYAGALPTTQAAAVVSNHGTTVTFAVRWVPRWTQVVADEATLYSGTDSRAEIFGIVPQWAYLRIDRPPAFTDSRVFVFNPLTLNYAYVDQALLGPSGPAPGFG